MFEKYLKLISKYNVFLIKPFKKNNILQNPVIFGYSKITDLEGYKYIFLGKLYRKKIELEKILKKIKKNKKKLSILHYRVLKREIKFIYDKIDFLKNVYDFEANKLDKDYKINFPELDFDYYNKKFFGVTKKDICGDYYKCDIKIKQNLKSNLTITKNELEELLNYTKSKVNGFGYRFGTYSFMSHSAGFLNITSKSNYTLKEVITLFFHEMTHFFRRYNNIENYGTSYGFSDYMKLEEGFALYNEYLYGKKLIKGLKYNPYYEACFSILLNNSINESEKIEKIYLILSDKGYDKGKALSYYYRFYRYSSFGSNQFFLKDLVYTKGYNVVKKFIKLDSSYYDKFFSGKIGMNFIELNLYSTKNNFDTNSYFEGILDEISIKFNLKM